MELKDNHQAQALGRAGAESNPFNGIESTSILLGVGLMGLPCESVQWN